MTCPRSLFCRYLFVLLLPVLVTTALSAPVVDNPADPPRRETVTLRELWRVGGEDESDVLLGQVGVAASGPDGQVLALDSQLSQVLVIDTAGKLVSIMGREGEGPGEFRQPVGLYLPGDGTAAVQEAFPGRITYLGLDDGIVRDTWQLSSDDPGAGGFAFVESARQRGGAFALSGARTAFDLDTREIRNTSFLALVGADGTVAHHLSEISSTRSLVKFTIDELEQFNPGDRGLWDLSPDGLLYLVPRYDAYEIAVHDADGTLQRTITRPHDARVRTDEEKENMRSSMRININGQEPEIEWKLQDRVRCIDRLQILDDGSVWVRGSHAEDDWDEDGRIVYDVFAPDGTLQREVTVDVPGGGAGDRLLLLDDGRFLLAKGMEDLAVTIAAGDGDEGEIDGEELGDTLVELICFEVVTD